MLEARVVLKRLRQGFAPAAPILYQRFRCWRLWLLQALHRPRQWFRYCYQLEARVAGGSCSSC